MFRPHQTQKLLFSWLSLAGRKRCMSQIPVKAQTKTNELPNSKLVGVDLLRTTDQEEDEHLFRAFEQLNVQTEDRVHKFNVKCDRVIKFIKIGGINKPIAVQYCHYLAHLTRTAENETDSKYYAVRCLDITMYLLRNRKDLPLSTQEKLLCDTASSSLENCQEICYKVMNGHEMDQYQDTTLTRLMSSCYQYKLWDLVEEFSKRTPDKRAIVNINTVEPLVRAIIDTAPLYKGNNYSGNQDSCSDPVAKLKLREQVLRHMFHYFELCTLNRVKFVTRSKNEFIEAMKDLDIEVVSNPTIKATGRCTSCNTMIPVFDNNLVAQINAAIKVQLELGADKGLLLNAAPSDCNQFNQFLKKIHDKDKRPIDCVIDGLNIAYKNAVGFNIKKQQLTDEVHRTYKVHNHDSQVRVLLNSIIRGDMLSRFRKIVVVGKHHMSRWPGLMEFFEKHGIYHYWSHNNTEDDLFQLYASTLSPKTVIVTNDFLRDHVARLEGEDRENLERWIDTHQAWLCPKRLRPVWPTPYEKIPSASKETNRFHLPIIDFHQLISIGHEAPPHLNSKIITWVCCRPKEVGLSPSSRE